MGVGEQDKITLIPPTPFSSKHVEFKIFTKGDYIVKKVEIPSRENLEKALEKILEMEKVQKFDFAVARVEKVFTYLSPRDEVGIHEIRQISVFYIPGGE